MRKQSLLCLALVAMAPLGAADGVDHIMPPTWVGGSYDPANHTVNITWNAPNGDLETPYVYEVYRDGGLVTTTNERHHVEPVNWTQALYHVVASHAGNQSLPSSPLVAQSHPQKPLGGLGPVFQEEDPAGGLAWPCPILGTRLLLDTPPFLFFVVYEQCMPALGKEVDDPEDGPVEIGWG